MMQLILARLGSFVTLKDIQYLQNEDKINYIKGFAISSPMMQI